ncbi:hypothetical protein [Blastococcus sp. SYSU D01042]
MAAVAVALSWLTPPLPELTGSVLGAQRTADTAGAEALLLAAAGLLAWAVWAWGVLGLLLTAGSALPGALGSATGVLSRVVLPAGARRGAALALGLGLAVAAPAAAAPLPAPVPDWPLTAPAAGALPDWPVAPVLPVAGDHVVVRGDRLWDIAAADLSTRLGRSPTPAETVGATHAWWAVNAAVIGSDPDLLLPGQVLRPPP